MVIRAVEITGKKSDPSSAFTAARLLICQMAKPIMGNDEPV